MCFSPPLACSVWNLPCNKWLRVKVLSLASLAWSFGTGSLILIWKWDGFFKFFLPLSSCLRPCEQCWILSVSEGFFPWNSSLNTWVIVCSFRGARCSCGQAEKLPDQSCFVQAICTARWGRGMGCWWGEKVWEKSLSIYFYILFSWSFWREYSLGCRLPEHLGFSGCS